MCLTHLPVGWVVRCPICVEASDTDVPPRPCACCCRIADDKFRANFLWGRKPMLAACAARLYDRSNMIWVDLGGGTGVSNAKLGEVVGVPERSLPAL